MNLMCTRGMEDKVEVTDCMDFAIVVYHGNSLCERHFNMETTKIMSTPSNGSEILRILHGYKYGKTAMSAGKTMRPSEGVPEAEEILGLITKQESTVHVTDSEMREKCENLLNNILSHHDHARDAHKLDTDQMMQLFDQHLQLAELRGRRIENEEISEILIKDVKRPIVPVRVHHILNNRFTAIDEHIKGLK